MAGKNSVLASTKTASKTPARASKRSETPQAASETPKTPARAKRRASKAFKPSTYLMAERLRTKTPANKIVTMNQIASWFGVSGKTVRGIARASDVIGNDGKYTRYGFVNPSDELTNFVSMLADKFGRKPVIGKPRKA